MIPLIKKIEKLQKPFLGTQFAMICQVYTLLSISLFNNSFKIMHGLKKPGRPSESLGVRKQVEIQHTCDYFKQ